MKLKYKAVMFLTLLIFCVGSVSATNIDDIMLSDTAHHNSEYHDIIKQYLDNNDREIQELNNKVKNLKNDVGNLRSEVVKQDINIKELNDKLNKQDIEIQKLKEDNKVLNDKLDKVLNWYEDLNTMKKELEKVN